MSESFIDTYGMTLNLNVAMANGYFGEDAFRPLPLINAIYMALYGQMLPIVPYYYFGVPDKRLMDKFDLKEVSDHAEYPWEKGDAS